MFRKIFSLVCILALAGCEAKDNTDVPGYAFSDTVTVASVSDTAGGPGLAKITVTNDNYVIIVTDKVHLQRLKDDKSGYQDIPTSEFTIIAPGDQISFAWLAEQIDYQPRPPVVYADTIVVLK
jgi:hypothetical protein